MSGSDSDKESSGENAAATTTVAKSHRQQEEIDALEEKVLNMPEITERMPVEQRRRIADAKRSLWNKILERKWILEQQRVRECVDKAKELGLIGPPDADECPFCFDDISEGIVKTAVDGPAEGGAMFPCCGKVCCLRCGEKLVETNANINTCPFCRSKLDLSDKEAAEQQIERAESGDAGSQSHIGSMYANGTGVAKDMHKARHWFKCAALQGDERAQTNVGTMYMEGLGGEQSYSEAERFLKMAAKKSCPEAQRCLGILMAKQGKNQEALQWCTISASQGSIEAQKSLAAMYDGLGSEGWTLSYFWGKKIALAGDEDFCFLTTMPILVISSERIGTFDFSTMVKEVGHNPIPEVLFWLRKATSVKESQCKEKAAKLMEKYDSMARERCSGCWELAESFDVRLKACRCHAAFYCSKKCQIDHWKGGHLLDCCDKDGKFHPCPNDDKYN